MKHILEVRRLDGRPAHQRRAALGKGKVVRNAIGLDERVRGENQLIEIIQIKIIRVETAGGRILVDASPLNGGKPRPEGGIGRLPKINIVGNVRAVVGDKHGPHQHIGRPQPLHPHIRRGVEQRDLVGRGGDSKVRPQVQGRIPCRPDPDRPRRS